MPTARVDSFVRTYVTHVTNVDICYALAATRATPYRGLRMSTQGSRNDEFEAAKESGASATALHELRKVQAYAVALAVQALSSIPRPARTRTQVPASMSSDSQIVIDQIHAHRENGVPKPEVSKPEVSFCP